MKGFFKFNPKASDPERFKLAVVMLALIELLIEKGVFTNAEISGLVDSLMSDKDTEARSVKDKVSLRRRKSSKVMPRVQQRQTR